MPNAIIGRFVGTDRCPSRKAARIVLDPTIFQGCITS